MYWQRTSLIFQSAVSNWFTVKSGVSFCIYFADDPHRSPPSSSSIQSSDNGEIVAIRQCWWKLNSVGYVGPDPLTVQHDLWDVLSAIGSTHPPLQPVLLQDDGSLCTCGFAAI